MAKASSKETEFAVYFLRKLHGNADNPYLITAVVAWLRQESGGLSRVIGNNPFNIRSSKYASGYRKTNGNGRFAIFSSLKMGAYATAQMLVDAGHDWRRYDRIVAAARRGDNGTKKGQQQQALDFLMYIALSAWNVSKYGVGRNATVKTYDPKRNHLVQVWAGITGISSFKTAEQKEYEQRKKRDIRPKDLAPPSMPPNIVYLDPYAMRGFYRDVHRRSDMGNLPN